MLNVETGCTRGDQRVTMYIDDKVFTNRWVTWSAGSKIKNELSYGKGLFASSLEAVPYLEFRNKPICCDVF